MSERERARERETDRQREREKERERERKGGREGGRERETGTLMCFSALRGGLNTYSQSHWNVRFRIVLL